MNKRTLKQVDKALQRLEFVVRCDVIYKPLYSDFPPIGRINTLYVDGSTGKIYIWNSSGYVASGGTGTNINVTNVYSNLPDPVTSSGLFYWVENDEGTWWLPGGLGGSYYKKGLYYSNGVNWETAPVPYQATQTEVNIGTEDSKFVTPKTLKTRLSNLLPSEIPVINYLHDQGVPSSTWTVTHNLNKYPSVTVIDTAYNVIEGSIEYLDTNTVQLTFITAFSGKATFN